MFFYNSLGIDANEFWLFSQNIFLFKIMHSDITKVYRIGDSRPSTAERLDNWRSGNYMSGRRQSLMTSRHLIINDLLRKWHAASNVTKIRVYIVCLCIHIKKISLRSQYRQLKLHYLIFYVNGYISMTLT